MSCNDVTLELDFIALVLVLVLAESFAIACRLIFSKELVLPSSESDSLEVAVAEDAAELFTLVFALSGKVGIVLVVASETL
jgi:hypothetical protein